MDVSSPDSHSTRTRDPESDEVFSIDLAFSEPLPATADALPGQQHTQAIEWRVSDDVVLEQVSTDPYELSYACLLIPRFQDHLLQGDIEEELRGLMKDICVSQDWKLDFLTIKPDYLQWIVRARAATAPRNIMQVFRSRTSRAILEDFPLLSQQNVLPDFWAPAYVMIVGREPHPQGRINEFIRLTRQQQTFRNRRDV